MEKLILKESYTREEADFMSLISATLKENPDTFQGDSAYWSNFEIEVEFAKKELWVCVDKPIKNKLYYALTGIANNHHYKFVESFSQD